MNPATPQPLKTSWPIKPYLGAVVFALLTMGMFSAALDGREANEGRIGTQAGICLILVLRLLWAVRRREQSRTWMIYIVCMLLAALIWVVALEPLARALGRG